MPYSSPQPAEGIVVNTGLDKVLLDLQERFNSIPWLEGRVYRRAYSDTFPNPEGTKVSSPQVYMGNKQYYDASVNDHLPCAVFFQAKGAERVRWEKQANSRSIPSERTVALLFWGNVGRMQNVVPADYIFSEPIKTLFFQKLAKCPHVQSIDLAFDEPIEDVFEGFTIFEQRQYNKFPFFGIRINFTIKFLTPVDPC